MDSFCKVQIQLLKFFAILFLIKQILLKKQQRIPKNPFSTYFLQWKHYWDKCVNRQRVGYFGKNQVVFHNKYIKNQFLNFLIETRIWARLTLSFIVFVKKRNVLFLKQWSHWNVSLRIYIKSTISVSARVFPFYLSYPFLFPFIPTVFDVVIVSAAS